MEKINSQLQEVFSFLISYIEWGMLFSVIGGGLLLLFRSRGVPLLKMGTAFRLLFSREGNRGITRFEALSAVLSSTVGLGNISGVAIAVHMGGPGVLVWMWITALLGMIIKFYSCSLAVTIRSTDAGGHYLGGPMYYMSLGIKRWGKPMAIWFSVAGLFGVLPAFTVNQFTQTVIDVLQPDKLTTINTVQWKVIIGGILSIITSMVIFGGLSAIVSVSARIVPLMVGLYLFMGLYVLATHYTQIPATLLLIFQEAFNLNTAVLGGFWGLILLGVRRAVFSNESGVGNAPMYHGQSQSKCGTQEGLSAMLGPFLDTIVVCSITGLVVIISKAYLIEELNGIVLTLEAFRRLFFGWGDELLLLAVSIFGISTLFTYSYYGTKCLGYLTNQKWGSYYNYFYIAGIIFFALTSIDVVIGLIDLSFALMSIPNMIALIYLSSKMTKKIRQL